MITVMLKLTARTSRPAGLAGRARRSDKTAAPGNRRRATTPGKGARGECARVSATDNTTVTSSQRAVGAIADESCLTRGQNADRCDQRRRGNARRSPRRDQRSLGCVQRSVRRDQRSLDEDQRVAMVDGLLIAHLPLAVPLAQSPPRSPNHPRGRRTDTPSLRRGASHSFEISKTPKASPMPPRQ